jgi:hypothetical protein
MDEDRRNHLFEEPVTFLSSGNHRSERHVLVMKEQVLHKSGFTGAATPDENCHCVLRNVFHIELPEIHTHGRGIRGHF